MTYHYGCAHIFIIEDRRELHGFWVSYLMADFHCANCNQKRPLYKQLEAIKAFLLAEKEKEKEIVWQSNTIEPESLIDNATESSLDWDWDIDGFE